MLRSGEPDLQGIMSRLTHWFLLTIERNSLTIESILFSAQ